MQSKCLYATFNLQSSKHVSILWVFVTLSFAQNARMQKELMVSICCPHIQCTPFVKLITLSSHFHAHSSIPDPADHEEIWRSLRLLSWAFENLPLYLVSLQKPQLEGIDIYMHPYTDPKSSSLQIKQ